MIGQRTFFVISIIFICILLNICLLMVFYGTHIIPGADEIRLFNRGKAIAHNEIDLLHCWDNSETLDPYPPGYAIIISEIILLFPALDPFGISIVYKFFLFFVTFLLYFWLGNIISFRVGLLAVFFKATFFQVFVTTSSNYVYLFSSGVFLGGGIYTEISVLLIMIFFLRYYMRIGSPSKNLLVIFIVNILHGLTHISGFITFTILILFVLILIYGISYYRLRHAIASTSLSSLKAFLFNRLITPLYVILITPGVIFAIHYYRVISELEANAGLYRIEYFLPLPFSIPVFIAVIILMFTFGIMGLIFKIRAGLIEIPEYVVPKNILAPVSNRMIMLYILLFLIIVIATNLSPSSYDYSSFAITPVFSSLLPSPDIVPVLSFLAGILLFILVLIGILAYRNNANVNVRILSHFYIASYAFFAVIYLFAFLLPHRSMLFIYFIPLFLAISCISFSEYFAAVIGKTYSSLAIWLKRNTNKMIAIIIVLFVCIAIVSRANIDPLIRDSVTPAAKPLVIGQIGFPIVTTSLLNELKQYIKDNDAILSTPETQAAIYSFFDIRVMCTYYHTELKSTENQKYHDMVASLYYMSGKTPSQWLEKYNASLVVIGAADANVGSNSIGNLLPPISKLRSDPALKLVWEDEFGQMIFIKN